MARKKFTQLPAADTPLSGDEIIAIVQDGVSKQATTQDIADLGGGGGGGTEHWRGAYNASGNTYPEAGSGSGVGGAIQAGDHYYLSVGGTLNGDVWNAGAMLWALTDTPGQTNSNWLIKA